MLWLVPMELLEQRYTVMMHDTVIEALGTKDIDHKVIMGEGYEQIDTGAFLDSNKSVIFKSQQLIQIAKAFEEGKVKDGDKFFFYELWFPGIEQVKIMAMAKKINIEIYGMLHGGTWMDSDFMKGLPLGVVNNCQAAYINCADKIFLGSDYHKKKILRWRDVQSHVWNTELIVTRLPFDRDWVKSELVEMGDWLEVPPRVKAVVFPLRPHLEKGIREFIGIGKRLLDEDPEVEWWFSCGGFTPHDIDDNHVKLEYNRLIGAHPTRVKWFKGVPKSEFYKIMSTAQVQFSGCIQESFGYAIMEGAALGCIPVVPYSTCYPEMLAREYCYKSLTEAEGMIKEYLKVKHASRVIELYGGHDEDGIYYMLEEMGLG